MLAKTERIPSSENHREHSGYVDWPEARNSPAAHQISAASAKSPLAELKHIHENPPTVDFVVKGTKKTTLNPQSSLLPFI